MNFEKYQEIVETLEAGGLTDQHPELAFACRVFWETGYTEYLKKIMEESPWLINQAKRNRAEIEYAESENPYRRFPDIDDLDIIGGRFNLGYVNHDLLLCGLDPLDYTRGLQVVGEIGSGKTYFALRLIDQVLSIPKEERGYNIIIVQIVKRDADFLIRKHPALRILEWKDFRRNMFEVESWDTKDRKFSEAAQLFSAVNYLKAATQPILHKAINMADKAYGAVTFSCIYQMIKLVVSALDLEGYEKKNVTDKLKVRLSEYIDTGDILNSRNGLKVEDFWSKEDICLNVMDQQNEYIYATAVTDLLMSLQAYHEKTKSGPDRLRTLIVIDECRSLFPVRKGTVDYGVDRYLEKFVTAARSSGIGRITLTQEPQSVTEWLTNNSAFFITFPIGGEAVDKLKKLQNLSDDQIKFMNKIPKQGTGVFRDRRFDRPYLVQVPGDLDIVPITQAETAEIMQPFLSDLHAQFPKALPEPVDPEDIVIVDTSEEYAAAIRQEMRRRDALTIVETLLKDPFTYKTQLREKTGLTGPKLDNALKWLESKGATQSVKCKTLKGKNAEYIALTDDAQAVHRVPMMKRISPSHFRHTLYCERVKEHLENKGLNAQREFAIAAGGLVSETSRIDVYAVEEGKATAYEITLTLKRFDITKTISKCFSLFRVDELVFVCEREDPDLNRVKYIVSTDAQPLVRKIKFKTIRDFG